MNELNYIRVSCAGLARIIIEDKYLLILNANSVKAGKPSFGPLGGALEYNNSIKPFLDSLGVKYEKGHDLRLLMPEDNFERFEKWFLSRQNREMSCIREIYEELALEENIVHFSPTIELQEEYIKTTQEDKISNRVGANNAFTKGFYEIYEVQFSENLKSKILKYLSTNQDPKIRLVTREEILSNDPTIGSHVKNIL